MSRAIQSNKIIMALARVADFRASQRSGGMSPPAFSPLPPGVLAQWQRREYFKEVFGLSRYMMDSLARDGFIRSCRMPKGYGLFFCVGDVVEFLESGGKPAKACRDVDGE